MFLYAGEGHSINSLADLAPGLYRPLCRSYVHPVRDEMAILTEFREVSRDWLGPLAIELLIKRREEVIHHDFVKLPDGQWRDALGEVSQELAFLLPPELMDFIEFAVSDAEPIEVGGA